jgi:hypothetical protein
MTGSHESLVSQLPGVPPSEQLSKPPLWPYLSSSAAQVLGRPDCVLLVDSKEDASSKYFPAHRKLLGGEESMISV